MHREEPREQPCLHVRDPGTACPRPFDPKGALGGRAVVEDGVRVSDEQYPRAAASLPASDHEVAELRLALPRHMPVTRNVPSEGVEPLLTAIRDQVHAER